MKFYFKLQFRRLLRMWEEQKIYPSFGIILSILLFIVFSKLLFMKIRYAGWIYLIISIYSPIVLSNSQRNNFLKSIFKTNDFYKIKLVENSMMIVPFSLYLLYEKLYVISAISLLLIVVTSFLEYRRKSTVIIPTPFKKHPFEFIQGFRRFFFLYLISYYLCYQAILVQNSYLCLFALALPYFLNMFFLLNPEQPYFVWLYSLNKRQFIWKKIFTSIFCTSILIFPLVILLIIFFSENFLLMLLVILLGAILQIFIISAKYAAFPFEMQFLQAMMFFFSLMFPPLLLFTIPYFYKYAEISLEKILDD